MSTSRAASPEGADRVGRSGGHGRGRRSAPLTLSILISWALPCALLPLELANAQVLLTEVQPNPEGDDAAEWLEIENAGAADIDIGGLGLRDFGPTSPRRYVFPSGTVLRSHQVIIIARAADAFSTMAVSEGFAIVTADFELAEGSDNPGVPNLSVSEGTSPLQLGNSGDAVILSDASLAIVSAFEWGTDRPEIPGAPLATSASSGESFGRVDQTGDSSRDFVVLARPTPGEGTTVAPSPSPVISAVHLTQKALVFGSTATFEADVTDPDGLSSVLLFAALANSPSGTATTDFVALPMSGTEPIHAVTGTTEALHAGLSFSEPRSFHEQYVRFYVRAEDRGGHPATSPAGARPQPDNAAFFWENVLPSASIASIAEVRAQDGSRVPLYLHHAVRVEGVVISPRESFVPRRTNFFIRSLDGTDAIRVYDPTVIAEDVAVGDIVEVTGRVGTYFGLRQVGDDQRTETPALAVRVTSRGAPPAPRVLTIAEVLINPEPLEGQFLRLTQVELVPDPVSSTPPPDTWPNDTTLYVADATGRMAVRIARTVDLVGAPTPQGRFALQGILTQYDPQGLAGYQLQPRSSLDVFTGGQVDAGIEADAGIAEDAGTNADSGSSADAGSGVDAEADAGSQPDAGPNNADGGANNADAGHASDAQPNDGSRSDASLGPPDAETRADGSTGPRDAAASASQDAGIARDVPTWGAQASEDDNSGGCACSARDDVGPRSSRESLATAIAGLFALAWVARPRPPRPRRRFRS